MTNTNSAKTLTADDLANYVDDLVTMTEGADGVYRSDDGHAAQAKRAAEDLGRYLQSSGRRL